MTLTGRGRAPSVRDPYLSLRACRELVLVGVGDGIPLTEIGRGFVRISRTLACVGFAPSKGGTDAGSRRDAVESTVRKVAVDFFRARAGGDLDVLRGGMIGAFFGLVSVITSKLPCSLSFGFFTAINLVSLMGDNVTRWQCAIELRT